MARPVRLGHLLAVLVVCSMALTSMPAHAAGYVEKAQRQLNRLGCNAGPVDGKAGQHTRSAVIRFQAANRLGQDGRLGKRTRSKLHGKNQVRCDRRPVIASGKGRRVVLSQRQNYLWLVRANGSVVAQGPVVDNPGVLRPGDYRVGSKCGRAAKIRRNSDYSGSLRLDHFTRFAPCGIGFHRIPVRKSTGNQMHADWLLGTNLQRSAGCIRLSRSLAVRLWRFAGPGTKVAVRA